MSLQFKPRIGFDDWLAAERATPEGRSEYAYGEIFAMPGGTEQHNLIATNSVTRRSAPGRRVTARRERSRVTAKAWGRA